MRRGKKQVIQLKFVRKEGLIDVNARKKIPPCAYKAMLTWNRKKKLKSYGVYHLKII
jgi:hypothetical protein